MKKRHTIFLSRSYYPNIGGVEKHIYELSKELVTQGYKITIITEDILSASVRSSVKDYGIKGVRVIRIPVGEDNWFKKFRIWKWMWSHRELFKRSDIIHCHDVFYWYLPLAVIYPHKPVYTTFHGYESYPIKVKAIAYRKVFENMSNRTICVGDFMKRWYYANPTKVIYGAVNISKKSIIKPKKNSAIFIGRLDEHTGIDIYVKAVKLIRKKLPDFTLTVYGSGPLEKSITGDGIILMGEDPDADKEIPKFEYAFVSRYLTILEAMAARRLVVAVYDNPVKKDYLLMTPYKDWIIASNKSEDVARIIFNKLGSKSKITMITKSQAWVSHQAWSNLAREYINLWYKYEK